MKATEIMTTPAQPKEIPAIKFSAGTVCQMEGPFHSEAIMVQIWFPTIGPKFFGPFDTDEEAERWLGRAEAFMTNCEERCHVDLMNGDL